MRRRMTARMAGAAGLALMVAAGVLALTSVAGAQEPTGKIRLGHLSPATPDVNITLSGPEGPSSVDQQVGAGVGYGAVTGYLDLVPGRYSVTMRPAGAGADPQDPLTAGLQVTSGTAQTLLFFDGGGTGPVRGELVDDDLTPPDNASGKVRVVQGAEGVAPLQAGAVDGPRLATDLVYGTVTDYSTVAARTWDVRLSSGGTTVAARLPVGGGSVNTVVVTKDAAGGLTVKPLVDVAGLPVALAPRAGTTRPAPSGAPEAGPEQAVPSPTPVAPSRRPTPTGGVPAGGGGTSTDGPGLVPLVLALAAAPLLAYSASTLAAVRRRRS